MIDRIGGISQLVGLRAMQTQRRALNQALQRLATGQRINRAADDPAGLIASVNLDATLAALDAESDANHRAMHIADTADAALGQVSNQLIEAKKLALANANDSGLSDAEKQANQLEIDSIMSGIDRIARTTSFNGTKLLDGTTTISASGAKLKLDAVTTAEIDANDPGTIDDAINQVATQRARIGAFSRHTLQSRLNQVQTEKATVLAAVSMIRDTDAAMETSGRIRFQLLERATILTLKSSHKRSMLDMWA